MIGATIGAGVGPLMGQYGLILDSLLSVKLITATGKLVTASETENPDLFWAVRGAGANFGIIVSATYRVYNAPNEGNMIVADFSFPPAANVSLWELLASWDSDDVFPSEMGMSIAGSYNRATATVSPWSIPLCHHNLLEKRTR
jgi:FAD/FMN-containing dehydrogenase